PQHGTALDQLIKNADLAMYAAKAEGRHTHRLFEPAMQASAKARLSMELDLRQALVDGSFEIHYQPVVNLQRDAITACEALLRWRSCISCVTSACGLRLMISAPATPR